MGKQFEIRREVELPATPDEVWEAVATGPGTASWLFPEEPGPNDLVESDRPRRYAVRTEGEGGFFNAIEFVIEAREGGTAVLRYVHSGVFDDEGWDDQYDAVGSHTDFYLHTLGQYLEHFSPKTATYVGGGPGGINGPEASMTPDAFEKLKRELGASSEGDRVSVPNGGGDGVVDYADDKFLGVRTSDALYRFFGRNAFGGPVGMSIHDFADGADAAAAERKWSGWLAETYG
jgi:hypothetical protein